MKIEEKADKKETEKELANIKEQLGNKSFNVNISGTAPTTTAAG